MAIVCWGELGKSASDNQRIEQGIEQYVIGHNIDPNAHQIFGSSLYMHKSNSLLDHPDGSVPLKKLPTDKIILFTCFESLDGWNVVGNSGVAILDTHIYTDGVADDFSRIALYDTQLANLLNFTKNPFFQTTVYFPDNEYNDAFFGLGCYAEDPGYDSFGFKVDDADVSAFWTKNDTEYTQVLAGITIGQRNVYRAFADSAAEKIYFYVNGVLKYTALTNFPTHVNPYLFSYYIKTLDDVARHIYITDLRIEIDR